MKHTLHKCVNINHAWLPVNMFIAAYMNNTSRYTRFHICCIPKWVRTNLHVCRSEKYSNKPPYLKMISRFKDITSYCNFDSKITKMHDKCTMQLPQVIYNIKSKIKIHNYFFYLMQFAWSYEKKCHCTFFLNTKKFSLLFFYLNLITYDAFETSFLFGGHHHAL